VECEDVSSWVETGGMMEGKGEENGQTMSVVIIEEFTSAKDFHHFVPSDIPREDQKSESILPASQVLHSGMQTIVSSQS